MFTRSTTAYAIVWALRLIAATAAGSAWAAPFAALMFEDAPSVNPQQLLPVYRDALGRPLDGRLARGVESGLVAYYQSQGHLAPAPRLVRMHDDAGVLVMEMREPYVARVQLDGREQVDAAQFRGLVQELRAMRPLGRPYFEAWLQRANRLGFPVRGSLIRSSAEPHQYLAVLTVEERRWQGVAHVDNRGPAQLGHEIAQVSLSYRWPWEALGQIRLDVAAAVDYERLRYVGVAGSHRVRARGDSVRWKYARSDSTLPIIDGTRSVDYERERAEVGYAVPLVRRTRQRADVAVALRSYDLDQHLDDGRLLRRDRIRAVQLGSDVVLAADDGGRHNVSLMLSQGLDALGASLRPNGAEGDFTAVTADYGYRGRFNAEWQWFGDVTLQASRDRLPASERFFIGGRNLGGAFDPATLSGDQGLGARIGIERLVALQAIERPITAYGYYDHGWVWSNDDERPADAAASAGVGVRGQLAGLSWSLEVGVPVLKPDTPTLLEDDARVFFSLTQKF